MSNKAWDRISYAQSEALYREDLYNEEQVEIENWVAAPHTPQTKAAEEYNDRQYKFRFPDETA